MKHQRPLHLYRILIGVFFLWIISSGMTPMLKAQADDAIQSTAATATPGPPAPDTPIVPDKPKVPPTPTPQIKAELILIRHYTVPEQVRALEPFELHLEFQNVGFLPTEGFFLENPSCSNGNFYSEDQCIKPIPTITGGQSVMMMVHLRFMGTSETLKKLPGVEFFEYRIKPGLPDPSIPEKLGIYVLPPRNITDEAASTPFPRRFPKPDLSVHHTWTAKPFAKIEELAHATPVVLNEDKPTEFELVVELQNTGEVEATNVFIDFCQVDAKNPSQLKPIGSTCLKYIPANIPPGGKATASQTVQVGPKPTIPIAVTLTITYEFWYVEQWLKETAPSAVIYVYPTQGASPPNNPPSNASTANSTEEVASLESGGTQPVVLTDANLRQGPGTNYPVIGGARRGEPVQIIGRNAASTWWQIERKGLRAWVFAELVSRPMDDDAITITRDIPAAPPPTAVPEVGSPAQSGGHETASGSPPATSAGSEGTLPATSPPAQAEQPQTAPAAPPNAQPFVVIASYQTIPTLPNPNQPFQLVLTLRNIGSATARQLTLHWPGTAVVPLGTGTTQWLNELQPGEQLAVTTQLIQAEPVVIRFAELPLELRYLDANGQLVEQQEKILLLWQTASDPQSPATASTPLATGNLWLRIFSGLFGLGAEAR